MKLNKVSNMKVSSQFSKMEILLTFLFLKTVIAYPVDSDLRRFKGVLLKNALISMINYPLKNESFQNPRLIYARQLPRNRNFVLWEVSVMIENDFGLSQCLTKRCDIYVKQDKSGQLIANDEPEQCRCILNDDYSNQNQDGIDGEPVLTFFGDKIVEEIFQKGSRGCISEYRNREVLSTSMINATEQRIEGGTMYKINYKLIELTCTSSGMSRDCVEDDNSRIRHCEIEAFKNYHISVEDTPVHTTCEEKIPINAV